MILAMKLVDAEAFGALMEAGQIEQRVRPWRGVLRSQSVRRVRMAGVMMKSSEEWRSIACDAVMAGRYREAINIIREFEPDALDPPPMLESTVLAQWPLPPAGSVMRHVAAPDVRPTVAFSVERYDDETRVKYGIQLVRFHRDDVPPAVPGTERPIPMFSPDED